ncbi:MAG: HEPN domain-containing protein [Candidatus Sabulitectum sp.]|nr:HEPN domain-containing protein [Candidatus Sabulitectum sp.]
MKVSTQIEYWIDLADYDLDVARLMLKGGKYLYVGFMCHQVVEKMLKALYVSEVHSTPHRSHNLTHLSKQSNCYEKLSSEQKNLLDTLEPLNIEARYPTYKEQLMQSLTLDRTTSILHQTEELMIWIKKQL